MPGTKKLVKNVSSCLVKHPSSSLQMSLDVSVPRQTTLTTKAVSHVLLSLSPVLHQACAQLLLMLLCSHGGHHGKMNFSSTL